MSKGVVFISEFVRGWAAYSFSENSRDTIAKRCGFDLLHEHAHEEQSELTAAHKNLSVSLAESIFSTRKYDEPRFAAQPGLEGEGALEEAGPVDHKPVAEEDLPDAESGPVRLEPTSTQDSEGRMPEDWWPNVEPLLPSPQRDLADLPSPEPLLRRTWTRAIITGLAATFRAEGEPDIAALVDALACQRIPHLIPRRSIKSNRLGLYCYLDVGTGMAPFAADQRNFLRDLQHVLGKDFVTIQRFRGTPLRNKGLEIAHHTGQPILILGDLGIGRPRFSKDSAPLSEWIDAVRLLRERRCPVVALVPYPPSRWPEQLIRAIPIIFWDPSSGARNVSSSLRKR